MTGPRIRSGPQAECVVVRDVCESTVSIFTAASSSPTALLPLALKRGSALD